MVNDDKTAKLLLVMLRAFITRDYGERCPDVVEECSICNAWKVYDDVVKIVV
jgi:uncharacterized protein (DUF488 family)